MEPDDLASSLQRLAAYKASTVAADNPDSLVLGADTVVVVDGDVLGKPVDIDDARKMLSRLSGRHHTVMTAVALQCSGVSFQTSAVATTVVQFRALPDQEREQYLATAAYQDKAGAYGIQEEAMAFVKSVQGCYYNVVGLPVDATIGLFEDYQHQGGAHHE